MTPEEAREIILSQKKWPESMSVSGDLSLYGCTGLKSLPKNLSVSGGLNLCWCTGLKSLPESMSVSGDLNLYGCTSLSLRNGLGKVGGQIYGLSHELLANSLNDVPRLLGYDLSEYSQKVLETFLKGK